MACAVQHSMRGVNIYIYSSSIKNGTRMVDIAGPGGTRVLLAHYEVTIRELV
jgi:hypothetical protein